MCAVWGPACGGIFLEYPIWYPGVGGMFSRRGLVFFFLAEFFLIFFLLIYFVITFLPLFYPYFGTVFIIAGGVSNQFTWKFDTRFFIPFAIMCQKLGRYFPTHGFQFWKKKNFILVQHSESTYTFLRFYYIKSHFENDLVPCICGTWQHRRHDYDFCTHYSLWIMLMHCALFAYVKKIEKSNINMHIVSPV